jgi:ribose transport system substrate-binding protein
LISIFLLNKKPASTPNDSTGDNPSVTVTEKEIFTATPIAKKRYKVGVLFPFLAAPFWTHQSFGIYDQAKHTGIDIIVKSADGYSNTDKQNSQIQDLISQKVDAILIAPTSLNGNTPAIEAAINSGIKVFINVTGSNAKGVISRILVDDYNIGVMQANYMISALGGKGKVAMLSGPAGADWSINKSKGFRETIKSKSNIQIVFERFSEPEKSAAQKLTEELLVKYSDIDGIFTPADGMAIGVADVISNSGIKKKIILTTTSFSEETVPYIKSGKINYNIDENPVLQGRSAINTVVYSLNGDKVPEKIFIPTPGIDSIALKSQNLSAKWAPRGFSIPIN